MIKKIIIVLMLVVLVSGCTVDNGEPMESPETEHVEKTEPKEEIIINEKEAKESAADKSQAVTEAEETTSDTKSEESPEKKETEIRLSPEELEKIQPNELGKVMVIMYHSLGSQKNAYTVTPEKFRKDLERLYSLDYVLVSLNDYVNNTMDVPAGKSPVVITFDDGHISNFKVEVVDGENQIDPNSAVGILEEFSKENPSFGKSASFMLNGSPFGQSELMDYKLNYLIDHGYEIGNHTIGHMNLKHATKEQIQSQLGEEIKYINQFIKSKYVINTLALPFGARPESEQLKKLLVSGIHDGLAYKNIAVLNVGWRPEWSSIHKEFNFRSINRVQAGTRKFQLDYWIEYLEENPSEKYISDGNETLITIPKDLEKMLEYDKINQKEIVVY